MSSASTVYWDEGDVPHIEAQNDRDLFVLQGYVTAKERGFQMDFLRRAVAGRLAEILGRKPVAWKDLTIHLKDRTVPEADLLLRTIGVRRAAEESVSVLSDDGRSTLEAYAQGVNLAFEELHQHPPLEMRLLSYRPEPWVPADSLSIIKGMAFELSFAWRAVLLLDAIAYRLGDDDAKMRALFPRWPEHAPPPAAWNGLRERSADGLDVEESWRAFTAMGGAHAGSNAWVVSGAKTASGAPILCGDPHLMLTAPSPHMVVHLSGGRYDVIGSSVPGVPGVIMGHNQDIAWSMTASCGQDADVFVEELDLVQRSYKAGAEWLPIEIRRESIRVRGEVQPVIEEVHRTRHGPLIHEVTTSLRGRGRTLAHALRWTGHDASPDLDAVLGICRASDWTSFRGALRDLVSPALNFVYADREGHIGWQLAGAFPVRKDGSDGLLPNDGIRDEAGWERYLDLDELPHLFDPPEGVIVSANTKPVDDEYPWPLGATWEPPFRYQRIHELLAESSELTSDDMARIQGDQHSRWAERLLDDVVRPDLESRRFEEPILSEAREAIVSWHGASEAGSVGATLFYATYDELIAHLLEEGLGDELAHAYLELLNVSVLPFENLVQSADSPWLTRPDRADQVARAFERAVAKLSARLGPQVEAWRWGRLHRLWHRHRLHPVEVLRPVLSIGPFEVGGDGVCVNNAHYNHANPFEVVLGPGFRHIEVLGDWDRSRFITSTGGSGDPLSASYRAHADRWLEGGYLPLHFAKALYRARGAQPFTPTTQPEASHPDAPQPT